VTGEACPREEGEVPFGGNDPLPRNAVRIRALSRDKGQKRKWAEGKKKEGGKKGFAGGFLAICREKPKKKCLIKRPPVYKPERKDYANRTGFLRGRQKPSKKEAKGKADNDSVFGGGKTNGQGGILGKNKLSHDGGTDLQGNKTPQTDAKELSESKQKPDRRKSRREKGPGSGQGTVRHIVGSPTRINVNSTKRQGGGKKVKKTQAEHRKHLKGERGSMSMRHPSMSFSGEILRQPMDGT